MAIRLIHMGTVPPLRSQAVYHGVARAFHSQSPNTILLVTPSAPYICIGFHQEVTKEVDVEFCRAHDLPIVRREVGGGAVYLDQDQLFTQWVFSPSSLPMRVDERFRLHALPIIQTYKRLGIEAYFRPINDIQVAGRKIAGLGAARIGQAEVLVGNFMFDFNIDLMARILRVPDEKFRDKVYSGLRDYMTTMKKELNTLPQREEVIRLYVEECEKIFGERVEVGELTGAEEQAIADTERKFATEEWLFSKGGYARPAVKIHGGVWVGETQVKTPGGLIRITLRLRDHHIDDILISGDFTFYPQEKIRQLEETLRGVKANRSTLLRRIQKFYLEEGIQTPGVTIPDWVDAIATLSEKIAQS